MNKKTLTLPSDWNTLPFSSYQNLTYFSRLNSNATSSRKPSKPCRWSSYLFSLPSASRNCMDLLLLLSVPCKHKFLRQKSKLLSSPEEPLASSWGPSSREVLVNVCWDLSFIGPLFSELTYFSLWYQLSSFWTKGIWNKCILKKILSPVGLSC